MIAVGDLRQQRVGGAGVGNRLVSGRGRVALVRMKCRAAPADVRDMQARIFAERIQNSLVSGVKYEEDKRNAAIATECGHLANQRFSARRFSKQLRRG